MKYFLCLLCVLTLRLQAAEPAKTNAPTKVSGADMVAMFKMHYDARVAIFKEQNLAWRNVVLLGDSITEGFDVTKYFPGKHVLNRGIGADYIGVGLPTNDHRGVLRRMDNSVFDCAATDVFLLIGINDLGAGRSVELMTGGYREILQKIHDGAPQIRVHVESLLPTRDHYARHNENILKFNPIIKKMAAEFGYDYIDLHALMTDDKGELKKEFTRDGLHINDKGYVLWQAEVNRVMGW